MAIAQEVVDLSVPFYEGMPTDDLGPKIWERLGYSYSRQLYQHTQSRAGRVFLTTDHCGTHIDGPLRFNPKGMPIEEVPLERFLLPARLLDLRQVKRGKTIGARHLEEAEAGRLGKGEAAVLWTGHDLYLKDPDYFWHRPQLGLDAAEYLVAKKVGIVAADFPGIGRPSDDRYEIKRLLHRGGVMTAEQLRGLASLEGKEWHLFVGPLRVRGGAGSIVRAVGLVGWRARDIVDLTLDLYAGMPTLGAVPSLWTRANHALTSYFYKGQLSYQTHAMMLTEHAGTHFDAPYHFDEHGPAVDEIPPAKLLLRARVFDMTHKRPLEPIGPADFEQAVAKQRLALEPGDAAVIWTEHSKNYYTRADYGENRQFITAEGAQWLAARRPALIVTDLVGLDEPADLTTPVHNAVLHAGICMLQVTTNIRKLAEGEWYVGAFPINLVGGTGAPLRAFAARV
jgi:kynurenine formamidase